MIYLKYIILALAIFQYVKADLCAGAIGNLNDCLNKEVSVKSYGCCGLKFKYAQYYEQQVCLQMPKTQTGRDYYMKQILKSYHIEDQSNMELVCPEIEKEIKGYCSDYAAAMLDKGSDCFGLSLDNLKGQIDDISSYSCCFMRNNKESDANNYILPPNVNVCMPLQKDKASRDAYIKKWMAAIQEQDGTPLPFTFDDLTIDCGK